MHNNCCPLLCLCTLVAYSETCLKWPLSKIPKVGFHLSFNAGQKNCRMLQGEHSAILLTLLYPRYEVYRGYIVFAFSVIMFVCLFVCLSVNFFFVKDFSATTWVRILKFGTRLDSDELYCVTKEQPHIADQSLYLFIFLSIQWKKNSSKISQQLLGLGF